MLHIMSTYSVLSCHSESCCSTTRGEPTCPVPAAVFPVTSPQLSLEKRRSMSRGCSRASRWASRYLVSRTGWCSWRGSSTSCPSPVSPCSPSCWSTWYGAFCTEIRWPDRYRGLFNSRQLDWFYGPVLPKSSNLMGVGERSTPVCLE